MPQFRRSRRRARTSASGLMTYLVPGRRHPLPGRRRPGRGRPAPAPRARARPRAALQPALRRDLRRPRGDLRRGRGQDHGLPGADEPHVDHVQRRPRPRARPRPADVIRRKLRSAVTDSGRDVRSEEKPGVTNLIEIMAVATGEEPEAIEARYDRAGYGKFKEDVGEAVVALRPDPASTRICAAIPASCTRSSRAARRRRTRSPPNTQAYERVGFVPPQAPSRVPPFGRSYRATAAPLTRRLVAGLVDWMIVTVFFLIAQIPLGVLGNRDEIGESRFGRFSSSRRRPGSRSSPATSPSSSRPATRSNARSGHPRH